MKILTQNSKMRKSSQNGTDIFNFGIPAFQSKTGLKTCPNATNCVSGCYARSGTYRFGNVVNAYEARLELTQNENFVPLMVAEITSQYLKSKSQNKTLLIRIHDSGDFYSKSYAEDWCRIIELCPNVRFYAYTKMVSLWEDLQDLNFRYNNFRLIYSYGGSEDKLIQPLRHFHAKVFQSETDLKAAGYIDGTDDDRIAALGFIKSIGLVYHGQRKYISTNWAKIS